MEDTVDIVVPMLRATMQSIESFLQEPEFIWLSVQVAIGWVNDSYFVR